MKSNRMGLEHQELSIYEIIRIIEIRIIDDFFIILVKKDQMRIYNIRSNFHSLIDKIDNESLLMKFYDLMIKSTTSQEGQLYNQLSEEQKNVLMLAEEESNDPANLISYNQQKKKHKKWL